MERAQYNRHLASARGRNDKRGVETCNAVQRRTRRSTSTMGGAAPDTTLDVLTRIARERVPCLLETCYKDAPDSRESAPLPRFSRPGKRGAGETVASHGAF